MYYSINNLKMVQHCSLCLQPGHYFSTCTNYPVQELNNYILNYFVENIRYNALNYGLLNFIMKSDHLYFVNNLSLAKLKFLSKNFGLKTNFNRSILAENLISVYRRLAKRIIEEDENFFKKIAERNQLIEQQERDKNRVDQIRNIMDTFRLNLPNLHAENLQTYIFDIGTYIQNVANNTNTPIPIQLKNKFNILVFEKVRKEKENKEEINKEEMNMEEINKEEEDMDCPICYETKPPNYYITTSCNHAFCDECLGTYLKTCSLENPPHCSLCRTTISTLYLNRELSLKKLEEGLT